MVLVVVVVVVVVVVLVVLLFRPNYLKAKPIPLIESEIYQVQAGVTQSKAPHLHYAMTPQPVGGLGIRTATETL